MYAWQTFAATVSKINEFFSDVTFLLLKNSASQLLLDLAHSECSVFCDSIRGLLYEQRRPLQDYRLENVPRTWSTPTQLYR